MHGVEKKEKKNRIITAVYNTDFFPAESLTLSGEDFYIFIFKGLVVLVQGKTTALKSLYLQKTPGSVILKHENLAV